MPNTVTPTYCRLRAIATAETTLKRPIALGTCGGGDRSGFDAHAPRVTNVASARDRMVFAFIEVVVKG